MVNVFATLATLGPHELDLRPFEQALAGGDWPGRLAANPLTWGLLMAFVGSTVLAVILVQRRRADSAAHGPTWRRLAQSMQLNAEQRRLLADLARLGGHVNPAPLVISRGCFDRAARRRRPGADPAPVHTLRRQLFG